jgi:hypothetical protein
MKAFRAYVSSGSNKVTEGFRDSAVQEDRELTPFNKWTLSLSIFQKIGHGTFPQNENLHEFNSTE